VGTEGRERGGAGDVSGDDRWLELDLTLALRGCLIEPALGLTPSLLSVLSRDVAGGGGNLLISVEVTRYDLSKSWGERYIHV
jgi:hypothetical protein